jgi:hypothetical protein
MMRGRTVPPKAQAAVASVDPNELARLGTDLLSVLGQYGNAETPEHALALARTVIALEAMRRLDVPRTASFVRDRYGDELDTWSRGVLLSTGLRIKSRKMARFFTSLLTDDARVGRESYAYDYAMRYLTRFFRDGQVKVDVGDRDLRAGLQERWRRQLGSE